MNCRECDHELLIIGGVIVRWDEQIIEQTADHKTYTCINEQCPNYQKALVYES